jgi:hypothetical protein
MEAAEAREEQEQDDRFFNPPQLHKNHLLMSL